MRLESNSKQLNYTALHAFLNQKTITVNSAVPPPTPLLTSMLLLLPLLPVTVGPLTSLQGNR